MKKTFKATNHYLTQVYWLDNEEIKLFKNYLLQLWENIKKLSKVEVKKYIESIWFQWLLDSYRNREKAIKATIRKMKIKFFLKVLVWISILIFFVFFLNSERFL